jgi:hypothetical protein
MINEKIKCGFQEVPFKSTLSFEYLIAELKTISKDKSNHFAGPAKSTLKKLETVPELYKPISDYSIVKNNPDLIREVMSFVFNPMMEDNEISSALPPFIPKPFYSTKQYDKIFKGEDKKMKIVMDMSDNKMLLTVIFQAYMVILHKFYDIDIKKHVPYVQKVTDTKLNTVRYFKGLVNTTFTNVKVHGKKRKLSKQDLKNLFDHASDLDYWNSILPLEQFEFQGFICFNWVDVTHEYVISELKSDLLDKHSIISQAGFVRLKEKVRTLIGIPDLEFGLAAFSDFESALNQNVIWKSIIPQSEIKCAQMNGTFYEDAYRDKKIVLTDDMKEMERNVVVDAFLKRGIRSHAVVPLIVDEKIVGMIEFGSEVPGQLNFIQIKRLHELFPVFGLALKRSKEEMNDRIRAIVQEECTAIHSSVEWRFWEAAGKMLDRQDDGEAVRMEPIVFNDVVPVYGATDIRNSSIERNKSIQADLTEHLNLTKKTLIEAQVNKDMPLLDQLVFKIDQQLITVKAGLKAGDEVSILDFIKSEIEPVFDSLKEQDSAMASLIEQYYNKMDDELGVLYKKRKDFEESLTAINDEVGRILDNEQDRAQTVFPHYFEKYRTDGVEYNIYIGQSLVKRNTFDPLYVKNIRLWQLLVKAEIGRKIKKLQPTLKTVLDVTQLKEQQHGCGFPV